MSHWWEIGSRDAEVVVPKIKAVAYYRHSAQDRQENSIPIQQEQVREWTDKNGDAAQMNFRTGVQMNCVVRSHRGARRAGAM